jgi:hypothetical protein
MKLFCLAEHSGPFPLHCGFALRSQILVRISRSVNATLTCSRLGVRSLRILRAYGATRRGFAASSRFGVRGSPVRIFYLKTK